MGTREQAEDYFFWGKEIKPFLNKYKFVRKLSRKARRKLMVIKVLEQILKVLKEDRENEQTNQ